MCGFVSGCAKDFNFFFRSGAAFKMFENPFDGKGLRSVCHGKRLQFLAG